METVLVRITGRHAVIFSTPEVIKKMNDYFSYSVPSARFAPAYRLYCDAKKAALKRTGKVPDNLPGWDGKKRFVKKNGTMPAGLFRATREQLATDLGFTFKVLRKKTKLPALLSGIPLQTGKYVYQNECITAMCDAIPTGGGLVISATGSGKTATAGGFFARLPYVCLFVVDQVDLLYQSQKELASWLKEEVGVVGDSKYSLHRVTCATRQTLHMHLRDSKFVKWYNTVKVVIVDELHEQMNKSNFDVLEKIQPIASYGLTATLQLKKKNVWMRSYAFAGPVLYSFPLSEGVERKVLSQGAAIQLCFPTAIEHRLKYQEEYTEDVVDNELKLTAHTKLVDWLLSTGRYVITLVDRVKHVEKLSEYTQHEHHLAYGPVPVAVRAKSREQFEVGEIRHMIASRVFKKGTNIKRLDAILDLSEANSANDTQQKYGRGVRLHPDKKSLVYIDIGTQSSLAYPRFGKRSKRRARALRALGIKVKVVNVDSSDAALKAVIKFVKSQPI